MTDKCVYGIVCGDYNLILDISHYTCISNGICSALACTLEQNAFITDIDFSDCYLTDESLICLLQGLSKSKAIKCLTLKGNAIKGSSEKALGNFLKASNTITKLLLEWNSIGFPSNDFFVFCEGVRCNRTLKELNLNNNCLRNEGTEILAKALKFNQVLQTLHICSNSIGFLGGGALVRMMQKNSNICYLHVDQNSLPPGTNEILRKYCENNQNKINQNMRYADELRSMGNKLFLVEKSKREEVKLLETAMNDMKCGVSIMQAKYLAQIQELEDELENKRREHEVFTRRYSDLNSCLEQERNEKKHLEEERKMLISENSTYKESLTKERQEKEEITNTYKRQIEDLNETISKLKEQICMSNSNVQQLNATVERLENKIKQNEKDFEEKVRSLKNEHDQLLQENREEWKNDMNKLKEEYLIKKDLYQQKIELINNEKTELEEEIQSLKKSLIDTKMTHSEQMENINKKIRAEVEEKYKEQLDLEDKTKHKQEEILNHQMEILSILKAKITELNFHLDDERSKTKQVHKAHATELKELQQTFENYKEVVNPQLKEFEALKQEKEQWAQDMELMKQKTKEIEEMYRVEIDSKNETIQNLKIDYEKKIQHMIEEEQKRIANLKLLFSNYINECTYSSENRTSSPKNNACSFVPKD